MRKGKFFPVHAMKAYRGSRVIATLTPNLGARRRCQHHAPDALPPGKDPATH
jgi:hypothetical protein